MNLMANVELEIGKCCGKSELEGNILRRDKSSARPSSGICELWLPLALIRCRSCCILRVKNSITIEGSGYIYRAICPSKPHITTVLD